MCVYRKVLNNSQKPIKPSPSTPSSQPSKQNISQLLLTKVFTVLNTSSKGLVESLKGLRESTKGLGESTKGLGELVEGLIEVFKGLRESSKGLVEVFEGLVELS